MAAADNNNTLNELNKYSLSQAEKYLSHDNHTKAFPYLLTSAKISPSPEVTSSLVYTLRQLGLSLEKSSNYTELFTSYKTALSVLPNCPEIHNNLGAHFVRCGDIEAAVQHFVHALTLNPSFVSAKENLDNVSNALIERWHFPMLNDKTRNEMYFGAIRAAVGRGFDTVLDIGTGTGILSMCAAKCGAKSVHACEESDLMHQIAAEVLKTNQLDAKITLRHRNSHCLSVPDHLDQQVSLVVTEIVDSGLLGEGILPALDDAWERLLLPAGGRVVPAGATVWAACVECESIRLQNRILTPTACGVELTSLADQRALDFVPYTTENLSAVPGAMNHLSRPVSVTYIDFNDPQEIKKYLAGITLKFDVDITRDGVFDAVVMWFTLHLDDAHTLSTASDTCWEQAVYPIQSSEKIVLKNHSTVQLEANIDGNSINFVRAGSGSDPERPEPDTTWELNHDDMLRLNDDYYWQLIADVLSETMLDACSLLDLTSMPLAALRSLEMKAKRVGACEKHELATHLASANRLDGNRMEKCNQEEAATQKWDVVVMDLVEPSGILRQDILETVSLLRCANKGATFVPSQMIVRAVLVESLALLKMNRLVDHDNVLGLKIKDSINRFKVTNHIDVHCKQIAHKLLCESFQIFDFDFTDESTDLTDTSNSLRREITADGTIHAVVFWFRLRYASGFLDTFDRACFWRQACIVLDKPMAVKSGENVTIKAKCSHSCITISVE